MIRLFCCLGAAALVGCGKMGRAPDAQVPAPGVPSPQSPRSVPPTEHPTEKLSADLKALPEPNRYQVELHWTAEDRHGRWWLLRQDEIETRTIAQLDPTIHSFTDDMVATGKTYQYVLTTETPADPALRLSAAATIPRDLEVTGPLEMNDSVGIHRLFLRAKADVRPRHRSLTLVVDELIVETGALFRSRPPLSQAMPGWDASSAPGIFIKARTASGDLTFIADGERGGQGLPGASGAPGQPGAPGRSSEGEVRPSRDTDRYICLFEAGNGGPGAIGGQGRPGGKGGRGGNSANVFLRVDHAPDFHASVKAEPGLGGDGGPGGVGGEGGPGGLPGNVFSPCRQSAQMGIRGPNGVPGPPGEKGMPGELNPWCLKINRSVFGQCRVDSPEPNWKL